MTFITSWGTGSWSLCIIGVLLELKVARTLDSSHRAQLLNYLRATDIEVGLLLNFGEKPEFKRVIFDNLRKIRK